MQRVQEEHYEQAQDAKKHQKRAHKYSDETLMIKGMIPFVSECGSWNYNECVTGKLCF